MQQALLRSGLSYITLRILIHHNHDAAERRRTVHCGSTMPEFTMLSWEMNTVGFWVCCWENESTRLINNVVLCHHHNSVVSSTASSTEYIYCFLFQFPVFSCFLKAIQQLLTCSSSFHHFYLSFYVPCNMELLKAVPMQGVSNPATLPSFYCM